MIKAVTQWFSAEIKPHKAGVYEKQWPKHFKSRFYSFWDGEKWCECKSTPEDAIAKNKTSQYQNDMWRGLASKP